MSENLSLATIVVTYNGEKWINKCFGSLVRIPLKQHKIVVIDNGSTDNTIKLIREKFPQVEIIETGNNLGFGAANNMGIRKALEEDFDFVFLLNQDAWLTNPDELVELLNEANDKNIGICSPIQLNAEHKPDLAFARYLRLFAPKLYQEILSEQLTPKLHNIKFINAASWVISKPCLEKCGGFAPVFYHYGEDSNYADRAIYHGFKIAVYSGATIIHDRPQIFMIDLEKEKYRKRIHALALNYLTDINHTLFSQFLYLISEMAFKAFKNGTSNRKNKIFIPIQSILYVFKKLRIIISTRKQSKREKSFL